MRLARILLAAVITLGFAGAVLAASPGSPEWYIGYGKENLAAKNYERAADQFQDALRIDPNNAEARALLAEAQAGLRGEQTRIAPRKGSAAPAPAPTAAPAMRVGDVVEIDRFSDDKWGSFGRIVEIKEPSTACPRFYIRTPASDPDGIVLNFMCGRVRPAGADNARAAIKPPVSGKGGPLILGDYACDTGSVGGNQIQGALTLRSGGVYNYVRGDGRYTYNPATGRISFTSGYFATTKGTGTFTPGKRVSQIDIDFAGPPASYWSCGHNN